MNRRHLIPTFFSLVLHGLLLSFFLFSGGEVSPENRIWVEVIWETGKSFDPTPAPDLKATAKIVTTQKIKSSKTPLKKTVPQTTLSSASSSFERKEKRRGSSALGPKKGFSFVKTHQPLPVYPWVCRKRGQEGIVKIRVVTNERGGVINAQICESSGHTRLDEAALRAVDRWILGEGKIEKTLAIAFSLKDESPHLL